MDDLIIRYVSDTAVLVEVSQEISDETFNKILALDREIIAAAPRGVKEVTPALINILVEFDPLQTDHEEMEKMIRGLLPIPDLPMKTGSDFSIPVCYEKEYAPDLASLADDKDLTINQIINLHTEAKYKVSMYGFSPGYAYLTGTPEAINVPRKEQAVRDVPKGSVIIAGSQCIITTMKMPTGWTRIGQTTVDVFTNDPQKPFLFDVGDTVRFHSISVEQYESQLMAKSL